MKLRLLILFLFVNLITLNAQTDYRAVRIVQPSPTAAAIAKYGDVPVSKYTGVPNIGIPLYTAQNKDLSVPITLNYHAGGIRVEDEASWVGLGWSLSCGGAISRSVRSGDDLPTGSGMGYADSYLPTAINSSNDYATHLDETMYFNDQIFMRDLMDGLYDSEPDIFNFNFNGRSGKFIIKKRANTSLPLEVMIISQEELDIKVAFVSAKHNFEWVITDEKGVKYFFGTPELTINYSGAASDESFADQNALEGVQEPIVTSWYLDKILAPTGQEINFSYVTKSPNGRGTRRVVSRSQTKEYATQGASVGSGCNSQAGSNFTYFSSFSEVHDVYLKTITFPNGKVEFNTSNREDIAPAPSNFPPDYAKKLDEVVISSGSGSTYVPIKKYLFNYAYFLGNGSSPSYADKRLKLLSVTESDGTNPRPSHTFTYNSLELPAKYSKAIDHWGYYNGANNEAVNETIYGDFITNGTLLPPTQLYFPETSITLDLLGADRNTNAATIQAGTLTDITYPTGGSTHFEYEPNEYYEHKQDSTVTPHEVFLQKFGPDTQVPNFFPEESIIELDKPTTIKLLYSAECYGGNSCLQPEDEFEYDLAKINSVDGTGTPSYLKWIGYTLTGANQSNGTTIEESIYLPAGKYKFTVFGTGNYVGKFLIQYKSVVYFDKYNHLAGGLRTKEIKTYDGIDHNNDRVIKYTYNTTINGMVASTGKLMSTPVYSCPGQRVFRCAIGGNAATLIYTLVRSSTPIVQASNSAQGNVVGYSSVTEYMEHNGKTVSEFANYHDIVFTPVRPGVPTQGYLENGQLLKETIYAYDINNDSYNKIKEIEKTYNNVQKRPSSVKAMKIPSADMATAQAGWPGDDWQQGTVTTKYMIKNVKFYDVVSEWNHPVSETVRTFSQSDPALFTEEVTFFNYDHPTRLLSTGSTFTNSKQQIVTTTLKYPYDFTGQPVADEMVARHQIGNVLEHTKTIGSTNLESVKVNYDLFPNNLILPKTIDVKQGAAMSYETRLRNHAYSTEGMLLSQSQEHDMILSYRWGYQQQYPIVEIQNASQQEFYYEGFEEGANTGTLLSDAKTGKRVGASGFILNFTVPNSREYILSYWYKNGSGTWEHKAVNYTGPVYTINDGSYIDEIRVYPKNSLMKTYTYEPLIGMKSETDAAGKTIYYEYDSYNQLKLIRDQNGKILKQMDYQYRAAVN